ncbi:hypothetical protein Leryth_024622 [Lithospermum erythrorhizon]|nr:hypothetical protein Leryth_024622 [Lithospermum erythrorhizon]
MQLLSMKLKSYLKSRMCVNSSWKKVQVILSNANVPGEGEHKVMSFIRAQRGSPGYDPNTRHCLYGLDADLIMLALTTHEIHFSILREKVILDEIYQNTPARKMIVQKPGNHNQIGTQDSPITCKKVMEKKPYEFLHIWILREYLELDLKITDPPKDFHEDLERLIDDFIFICFFAGNDFLPHMPSLEIHEGAIDLMMHVYRKEFKNLGGYLVDMSRVNDKKGGFWKQSRVEKFILTVGSFEEQIFRKRAGIRERKIRRILLDDAKAIDEAQEQLNESLSSFNASNSDNISNGVQESSLGPRLCNANNTALENTRELQLKLREHLRNSADTFKQRIDTDKVRLGEDGWKKRFYVEKFSADVSDEIECLRKKLVQKYTEGLCWVLLYYFSGVPSWTWFYPYYYGPFASDFKGLSQVKVKFEKGVPFRPLDQLMAVLPPRSAHALPGPFKKLMLDEISPIINFYPKDFEIDADGKRFIWQAICKLPFIEEDRLLTETRKLRSVLKDHEMGRNAEISELLFVENSTPLGVFLCTQYSNFPSAKQTEAIEIDASLRGLNGSVHLTSEELSVQGSDVAEDCKSTDVLCVFYKAPSRCPFLPRPLEGVEFPIKIVDESDISEATLWHENSGRTHHSNMVQFNSKGPNSGVESSYRRVGWEGGRGRGRNNWRGRQNILVNLRDQVPRPIYKPQSNSKGSVHVVEYRGAGVGWGRGRGKACESRAESWRQNDFPVSTTTTHHDGNVNVPWRPRAWSSSRADLGRQNEFPLHTSTRLDGNVANVAVPWKSREIRSESFWSSNNIGRPHSTVNYNAMPNKGTKVDIGLQSMSALRISGSDPDNEELLEKSKPHPAVSLHSEAQLKQRNWWRSDRWDKCSGGT